MAASIDRAKRGTGSIRERLPGVWEIRVVVGFDPIHSRSVQRSFTVHGDKEAAEQRRRELVDDFGISRIAFASEASRLTVAELLERFLAAPHLWKPATVASHQHVIRALVEDPWAGAAWWLWCRAMSDRRSVGGSRRDSPCRRCPLVGWSSARLCPGR
jgi:hypothetical protein